MCAVRLRYAGTRAYEGRALPVPAQAEMVMYYFSVYGNNKGKHITEVMLHEKNNNDLCAACFLVLWEHSVGSLKDRVDRQRGQEYTVQT